MIHWLSLKWSRSICRPGRGSVAPRKASSGVIGSGPRYADVMVRWARMPSRPPVFCHITQNWRAKPLVSRAAVVELIAATTTKTGLKVECALDERTYEKGIKITDAEMEDLDIRGHTFHPEWNYTVHPRSKNL